MRKSIKALASASAVIAGLAVAPALYAHGSEESGDSMMGSGMMGQGGMMGMMNMMGQMSEMMEGCNRMMQSMSHDGSERPNQQWREKSPDNNGAPGTVTAWHRNVPRQSRGRIAMGRAWEGPFEDD